ncbi:MAG: hydroxymethylbilane synthase [Pirellulales bacterium]|nr:hydroxymethylbilane synthase [Pirellulales bacterium]
MKLRLGTRASALARWQAEWVAGRLVALGHEVKLVPIATTGDQDRESPIETIGAQGVFTKEIQRVLLDGRIDVAVHSLKDLSTEPVPGLCLVAVPERASAADALVSREGDSFEALPAGATIGTGSLRRRAQLLNVRPDLRVLDLRGNVETRLAKLAAGGFDAVVLAEAGLDRLGLSDRITQILPCEIVLPAVGQGALGIEARSDDEATHAALAVLEHGPSRAAVAAERAMLAALEGGCLAPIAAWGRVEGESLTLAGRVLSPDGARRLDAARLGPVDDPEALGRRVAEALLAQGAGELIREGRGR